MSDKKVIECSSCQTRFRLPAADTAAVRCPGCGVTLKFRNTPSAVPTPNKNIPSSIQCPKCSQAIRLAANAQGKQFRCPGCHTVLQAPAREPVVTANRSSSAQQPIATMDTPVTPSESVFDASFDLGNEVINNNDFAQAPINPYAKSQRVTSSETRMPLIDNASRRILIRAALVFFASLLIPILGVVFGFFVIIGCMIAGVIAYFSLLGRALNDDHSPGLLCVLFPPLLGRYATDNWDQCGKSFGLMAKALVIGLAAIAGVILQVWFWMLREHM